MNKALSVRIPGAAGDVLLEKAYCPTLVIITLTPRCPSAHSCTGAVVINTSFPGTKYWSEHRGMMGYWGTPKDGLVMLAGIFHRWVFL